MKEYTFEIPKLEIKRELEKIKFRNVLLELPDGVKHLIPELIKVVREVQKDAHVYVSGEGCYGACYIEDCEAKTIGIDLIINVGHTSRVEVVKHKGLEIVFVPLMVKKVEKIKRNIKEFVQQRLYPLIREFNVVALSSTVEHYTFIVDFQRALEEMGFKVLIGKGETELQRGQITGCDYANPLSVDKECDVHIVLASGRFHGLGLAMISNKLVIVADILNKEIITFSPDEIKRVKKKRLAALGKMLSAKRIGVIVGTTLGQRKMKEAESLVEMLHGKGFYADIILMKEVTINKLLNLIQVYDAFVVYSCPRIALDKQYEEIGVPIILPHEVYEVMEETE